MYTCEECGGYCVLDQACADFICTECGLCFQDVSVGWTETGLPFESSYVVTKTVYEPIKYLERKFNDLRLTSEQRKRVTGVFQRIATVYQRVKGSRKSNLHYNYVIRRILLELGETEAAERVPRVKGAKKAAELDVIWDRIAAALDDFAYLRCPSPWCNSTSRSTPSVSPCRRPSRSGTAPSWPTAATTARAACSS